MLKSILVAKLEAKRKDLDQNLLDLKRCEKLIMAIKAQKRLLQDRVDSLENEIIRLEDELDDSIKG